MSEQIEIDWATIGKVVALFGLRGDVKVRLLTDIPNRFAELDAVYVGPDHIRYLIKSVQPYKGDMVLLRLEGFANATAAEALCNLDICIPLSKLAELPPDSYYQHDIVGLHVFTQDGHELGEVVDIIVTGSNDVYVVKTVEGREVLIPAIKDVITQIDLICHTMHIDSMPGLLDNRSNDREEHSTDTAERE